MDDTLDPRDMRAVLRNVGAYRQLRQHVRRKATWSLVFGAIMLGVWWMVFGPNRLFDLFSLIYLGLAVIEFGSGVINKIFPSAEGVLIDGLVLFGFGAANVARAFLIWQAGKGIDWLYVIFGAYWIFTGFSTIRSYAALRRAFAMRPTREHIRWFEDLIHEIRSADPQGDPTALDLPTRPPVRGKLLGDTAFFLQAGTDDIIIAARDEVEIERAPGKDREPVGYFVVNRHDFGGFPLDGENWRNYAQWKGRGAEPPTVRPAGYDTE